MPAYVQARHHIFSGGRPKSVDPSFLRLCIVWIPDIEGGTGGLGNVFGSGGFGCVTKKDFTSTKS